MNFPTVDLDHFLWIKLAHQLRPYFAYGDYHKRAVSDDLRTFLNRIGISSSGISSEDVRLLAELSLRTSGEKQPSLLGTFLEHGTDLGICKLFT